MKTIAKKAKDLQPGDVVRVEPWGEVGEVAQMEGGGVWYVVKGGTDGPGPDFHEAEDEDDVTVYVP